MIRITLIYRKSENAHFDFDYYVNRHVPMSRQLMSDCGLVSIEVEKVLRALDGGPSNAICVTHVDLVDEACLKKALELHGAQMMADFGNYTDITPEIHVCQVLTSGT